MPVSAIGQRLFDAAQCAFDAADRQAGFVEVEFHAQGVAAAGRACNCPLCRKCADFPLRAVDSCPCHRKGLSASSPGRVSGTSPAISGGRMTLPERQLANAIRALAMDAVQAANSGHPGMPMGMADVATVLYSDYLEFDPTDPKWADRDRFVLSAGHGARGRSPPAPPPPRGRGGPG